jgi:hypothetical protein
MKIKNNAGEIEKIDLIYNQIKIATADIDYEQMNDFNPNISATLLNIQPMPFETMSFGEQHGDKQLTINLRLQLKEEDRSYKGIDLVHVQIKKIQIKVVENIPVYTFVIWVPVEQNPDGRKYLSEFFKNVITFEISEMPKA